MSHVRSKAVTVRLPAEPLRRVMRARRMATQSELLQTLLREEEERVRARDALNDSAGKARKGEIDDRLL